MREQGRRPRSEPKASEGPAGEFTSPLTGLSGHRQIDHTADLALEIWAGTEEDLLAEAARAIVAILTEGAPVEETSARVVDLEANDREDRLVRWLNEVIYLSVAEGFLLAEAKVSLGDRRLSARLVGEADAHEKIRTELKSATYHDLEVAERGGRFEARVVIDV